MTAGRGCRLWGWGLGLGLVQASSNWSSEGVQMKFTKFSDAFPPDYFAPKMAVLHESFDVVFTEPSGCLNLLSAMTVGAYQNLRHEAQLAMKLLENPVVDGFDSLFMVRSACHSDSNLCASASSYHRFGRWRLAADISFNASMVPTLRHASDTHPTRI